MSIGMKRNERDGDEGCLGVLGGSLRGEVDTHMHILHSTFWGSWGGLGWVLDLGSSLVAFWGSLGLLGGALRATWCHLESLEGVVVALG